MATYLLACDRQNSPIDGVGFPGRSYTAYGAVPSPVGPMTGFCGQPRDARMDRYPLGNGHRRYNPVLMRFHEPDALSPFGEGGINSYAYCSADPVNRHDPSGRVDASLLAMGLTHKLGSIWLTAVKPMPKSKRLKAAAVLAVVGFSLGIDAHLTQIAGAQNTANLQRASLLSLGTGVVLKLWEHYWPGRPQPVADAQDEAGQPAPVQGTPLENLALEVVNETVPMREQHRSSIDLQVRVGEIKNGTPDNS